MTTVYYSTVLDHPADTVWSLIRDFNNYPVYVDGVTDSVIEDGRRGDEVGAVRGFNYGGHWIRQRLGAHSDETRVLTYVGLDPFGLPEQAGVPLLSPVNYRAPFRCGRWSMVSVAFSNGRSISRVCRMRPMRGGKLSPA